MIERISKLKYAKDHPHIPVVDDTLSFIRNALEEKSANVWDKRVSAVRWDQRQSLYSTQIDVVQRWELGRKELLNIVASIKNEIELYTYHDKQANIENNNFYEKPVIFLSHSSSDKHYGDALQKFIIGLGVKNDQLIYTAHPLHKIPLDVNIYDYLRKNIYRKIFMIILWSEKYLDSPACLNEMGAAWVTQSDYTNIFTPTFHFGNPKFHECAVDTRKMGAVLNGDSHCKANMIELKDKIQSMFGFVVAEARTTYLLDEFIKEILEANNNG